MKWNRGKYQLLMKYVTEPANLNGIPNKTKDKNLGFSGI
jgi:hypothetical protein